MKMTAFTSLFFLAFNASAIETSQCPGKIDFQATVEKVPKSSIYSKVPGWKEAQQALLATKEIETQFFLAETKKEVCLYKDSANNAAVLTTAKFNDPEMPAPTLVDQLVVRLEIMGSNYVTFLPVKSYSQNGVEAYSRPYGLKIKTQLNHPQTNRLMNIDLGMIFVSID